MIRSDWKNLGIRPGTASPAFSAAGLLLCIAVMPLACGSDEVSAKPQSVDTVNQPAATTGGLAKEGAPESLAVVRDRAKLMHTIYASTLEVMHHRYFHADRAVIPARAMEDVFSDIDRQTGTKANWISVNLRAMSLNHEPETSFEKKAAKKLAAGDDDVEIVEDGFFRRATPIPLHGGCISCHAGFSPQQSKKPKFAGLVISIPITSQVSEDND